MRSIFTALSILVSIIGLIFLIRGCAHPNKYQKELSKKTTTAVRVTQVYTEATHLVVVGIGFVSFGIFISFIGVMVCREEVTGLLTRLIGKSRDDTDLTDDIDSQERGESDS